MWVENWKIEKGNNSWEILSNFTTQIKTNEVKSEYEEMKEIKKELDSVKTLKFDISEIKKVSLEKTWEGCVYYWLFDLFQKINFWTDIETYFNTRIDKLKQFWVKEDELNSYYFKLPEIYKKIDKISDFCKSQIYDKIWEKNVSKIKSFKILNWILRVFFNDNSVQNFEIILNEKSDGLKVVKFQDNSKQLKVANNEKEKINTRNISYFSGALSIWVWVGLNERYIFKKAIFTDNYWKKHKVKIKPETKFENIPEIIRNVLDKIEVENNFKIQKVNWKEIFVENWKRIEISKMRESIIKEYTFEKFKWKLPKNNKISEKELEYDFEKTKWEMIKALDDIKILHWEKILPIDFLKGISWKSIHYLLFPIFFKEIHKNQSDLVSYFKWAWEYLSFSWWALVAAKTLQSILSKSKLLPRYSKTWMILYWIAQLAVWILWWATWVWLWEAWIHLAELDKWYNKTFPESEDFLKKYIFKKNENDNITIYWLSSFFIPDIADLIRWNIRIPWTPVVFWQHDVDFSTNKQEYMSSWIYRTPKEYNKRVDEFSVSFWEDLKDLFNEYFSLELSIKKIEKRKKLNLTNREKLDLETKERFFNRSKWREKLEKNIENLIYNWKFWWDKEINKKLKDKIFWDINIDNILSWKQKLDEVIWLIQAEIKNIKIDNKFIKEYKQEIENKEKTFLATFWEKVNSNSENSFIKQIPIFDYINSLPEKDKKYAYLYFKRTLNKEEVLQKWDYEYIKIEKVKGWAIVDWKFIKDFQISWLDVPYTKVEKDWKIILKRSIYERLISDKTVDKEDMDEYEKNKEKQVAQLVEWGYIVDWKFVKNIKYNLGDIRIDKKWKVFFKNNIKPLTRWDKFNQFTEMVKGFNKEKQFLERMKLDLWVIELKEIKNNEIKEYKDWTKVEKINWGLKLMRNWKKIIINLFEDWKLRNIQVWNNVYQTHLNYSNRNMDINYIPYIFLDKEEPFINIRKQDLEIWFWKWKYRKQNKDLSSKYATSKRITFENLFRMLDWKENITFFEDYDIFYDLILEKVKK